MSFVHLLLMGQKFIFQGYLLLTALIFSVFFPSIHALEHIADAMHEHECVHQYGETNTEITHQHETKDHCVICDFTLSSYLSLDGVIYKKAVAHTGIPYFFHATNHRSDTALRVLQLRGPPII